jgi:hypothetical protein
MIDWATAWHRASDYVAAKQLADEEDSAIIDQARSLEYDFGWVIFYNSRKFLEQGDRGAVLVGNVPFVVDRRDGSVHVTRTNWRSALIEYAQRYHAELAAGWVDSPES